MQIILLFANMYSNILSQLKTNVCFISPFSGYKRHKQKQKNDGNIDARRRHLLVMLNAYFQCASSVLSCVSCQ